MQAREFEGGHDLLQDELVVWANDGALGRGVRQEQVRAEAELAFDLHGRLVRGEFGLELGDQGVYGRQGEQALQLCAVAHEPLLRAPVYRLPPVGGERGRHGEVYIFHVQKTALQELLVQHGSYAHGTVSNLGAISREDLSDHTNTKEYALRPQYGDACWSALLAFRIQENDLFSVELGLK